MENSRRDLSWADHRTAAQMGKIMNYEHNGAAKRFCGQVPEDAGRTPNARFADGKGNIGEQWMGCHPQGGY